MDSHADLYVSNVLRNRICKYDAGGKYLSQWDTPSGVGGIAIDQDGSIYAAEGFAGRILKFRQQ